MKLIDSVESDLHQAPHACGGPWKQLRPHTLRHTAAPMASFRPGSAQRNQLLSALASEELLYPVPLCITRAQHRQEKEPGLVSCENL